jgi:hypothetical protein
MKPLLPRKNSITYSECECECVCVGARVRGRVHTCVGAQAQACAFARVALLVQHAPCMLHIACGLSGSTMFFDLVSQTTGFSEKSF